MSDDTISDALVTAVPPGLLANREQPEFQDLVPTMVGTIATAKARLAELQRFVAEAMVEGEDYGTVPGVKKPFLFKPGAEKLCEIYGYAPQIEVTNRVEEWGPTPFFHYEIRCTLVSRRSGQPVGCGLGSCNSREARYRWREQQRTCPHCGVAAIIKGKEEYGGGWLCFKRKNGCGAKFGDDDAAIVAQPAGQIENDDIATAVNTILKMAKKRALVDAVLGVTRSSALFTQDEDTIRPAESPPARASRLTPPAGGSTRITEPEGKRLVARAKAAGHDPELVQNWLRTRYGVTRLGEIRRADYDAILARVDDTTRLGDHVEDFDEPPPAETP